MTPLWLLRAKRWVQHPPSAARVRLVFGVIVICAVLYGLERAGLWPAWLTLEEGPRGRGFGLKVTQ